MAMASASTLTQAPVAQVAVLNGTASPSPRPSLGQAPAPLLAGTPAGSTGTKGAAHGPRRVQALGGNGLDGGLALFVGSTAYVSAGTRPHHPDLSSEPGNGDNGGADVLGMFLLDAITAIKKTHAATSNDAVFP
jgi:hypothetical protein